MTDKLSLYRETLGHLEEGRLSSLTEERSSRRTLDDYYVGTLKFCLEQGFWNFAMRSIQADSSSSIVPTFGFNHAFQKPNDWIRTFMVSSNENFHPQLPNFIDEPGVWYSDTDPMYIRYISNDNAYGNDLSIWPETYSNYVALRLARQACKRVTGSDALKDRLIMQEKRALSDARSKDAMNEPPGDLPHGTWVGSRSAGQGNRSRWNGSFI